MKKYVITAIMILSVILSVYSCKPGEEINTIPEDMVADTVPDDTVDTSTEAEVEPEAEPEVLQEEQPEESTQPAPAVGGSDYSFAREFIDEVYDVHIADLVVGREAGDKWAKEVFLKQTPEEMNALPTLYQAIIGLDISKEELMAKNTEEFLGETLDQSIIDALYYEDVESMKKALTNPNALYHEGTIYTFDNLAKNDYSDRIPEDVLKDYFDRIEVYMAENKLTKYMQEELDNTRKLNGIE